MRSLKNCLGPDFYVTKSVFHCKCAGLMVTGEKTQTQCEYLRLVVLFFLLKTADSYKTTPIC